MSTFIDGECLCGHVRYEATIECSKIRICHCTQCQVSSATAFRVGVLVHKDQFRLLSGDLKCFVKTAESGAPRALYFCPHCGTSIYGCAVHEPVMLSLRLGTARQRAQLSPEAQMWSRSKMPWLSSLVDIPSHEQGMPLSQKTEPRP